MDRPPGNRHETGTKPARNRHETDITFTCLQVGKVLDELDALRLTNETVVASWADHGWTLGEHAMWCKMANLELHTRVPLMLRVPWLSAAQGRASHALVELVDVYPTLAELAGISLQGEALEGTSLVPLLTGALTTAEATWTVDTWTVEEGPAPPFSAAFSQYPRCLNTSMAKEPPYLGTRDPCAARLTRHPRSSALIRAASPPLASFGHTAHAPDPTPARPSRRFRACHSNVDKLSTSRANPKTVPFAPAVAAASASRPLSSRTWGTPCAPPSGATRSGPAGVAASSPTGLPWRASSSTRTRVTTARASTALSSRTLPPIQSM